MKENTPENMSVKYRQGVTNRGLVAIAVASLIFGFIGSVWTNMQPNYTMAVLYNLSLSACALVLSVFPINAVTLASTLGRLKFLRNKVNLFTLTYIYSFAITAMFFNNQLNPHFFMISALSERYIHDPSGNYIPFYIAPSAEICRMVLEGGVPVPWSEWVIPILWCWLLTILHALFLISISLIFRRRWIDIEKVPFPQTMVVYGIMETYTGAKTESSSIRTKLLLIGFMLGLAVQIPIFMTLTFPWFPDIFGWRANTCAHGGTYVTSESPLAVIAGLTMYGKYPPHAAIAYLAPSDTLRSFILWYLLVIIIGTQIAYNLGYYTGITDVGGCGRAWCGPPIGLMVSPPFKWNATSHIGGLVGLTIFLLIGSRHYILETLKIAFSKSKPSNFSEIEKNEPISYRSMYLMFILSLIGIIVFWVASGFNLLEAILMPITAFLIFWSTTRIYGLIGFAVSPGLRYSGFLYQALIWPTPPERRTVEFSTLMWISNEHGSDCPELGWGGSLFSSFAAYRMASLTGVHSRDVLKIQLITMMLVQLASIVGMLWVVYTFGLGRCSENFWAGNWNGILNEIEGGNRPTSPPWEPYVLLGIAIVGVTYYLHSKFLWFPLDPVGFLLATTIHPLLEGIWLPYLIAYIAKTLTLKIGGSKAYEDYGIPVVSGFLIGTTISILIGGCVGIFRFFHPF